MGADSTTTRLQVAAPAVDKEDEMVLVYIAVGAGVVLLLWSALAFNALVTAHNRVNESWSGVDVQLARRHDLVPNLLEIVKGIAGHEREALRTLTEAQEVATGSSGRRGRQAAEYDLAQAIAEVRAVVERYPSLRGSEAFRRLQAQLAEVEGEIQYARRIYNSNVMLFNARVSGFPGLLVRRLGSFRKMGYFELVPVWRSAGAAGAGSVSGEAEQGGSAAAA
jgi:LemA protein